MRRFGLVGYPLGHSFSKRFFTEKFEREGISDSVYELFPIENITRFPALWDEHTDLIGLNVTIPYKEQVIPFLDALNETATAVGAVNCIRRDGDKLTGYNTDVFGFDRALPEMPAGTEALILGTGGASKAVAFILNKRNIPFLFVSRQARGPREISYPEIPALIRQKTLIINTTPLGMAPEPDSCPELPFDVMGAQHFVYDLVYNPAETVLLRRARLQGCSTANGLDMLHFQAEKAWEIWTNA